MKDEYNNLNDFLEGPVNREALVTYMQEKLPGFSLGVYVQEGLPLFSINDRMLDCLGYETQEEFSQMYDGLLINAVHPEEMARKERWYQIAVSQTSTNVWEYDLASHCILLNDGSEKQHGYIQKVENISESLIESGYIHPDS